MKREIHIFIFSVLFVAGQVLGIRSDACGQQVVFSAEDVELVASDTVQTHTFGIVLTHDLADPLELSGFQASLSLVGLNVDAPNVLITGVSGPIDQSYIFGAESSFPSSLISTDATSVLVGDFLLTSLALAESGSTLASISVQFDGGVEAGDQYRIAFDSSPSETFLAGPNGSQLDFVIGSGEAAVAAVPEPSTTTVFSCCLIGASFVRRRRS